MLTDKSSKIQRLCWYFVISGALEMPVLKILGLSYAALVIGLITIITAFFAIKENPVKFGMKRFVAIFAFVKYSPVSFPVFVFIFGDSYYRPDEDAMFFIATAGLLAIMVCSLIFGIMLMVRSSQQNKYLTTLKKTG